MLHHIDSEYPRHGTVFQLASLVAVQFRLSSIFGIEHCHFGFPTHVCVLYVQREADTETQI
jgi:hypothetical protein